VLFLFLCNGIAAQTCLVTNTVPSIPPGTGALDILVRAAGSVYYGSAGVRIYDAYDTLGRGSFTPIADPNFFWQTPLERCGVWAAKEPISIGFSVCIEIPEAKTYYMGFAADNSGTLTIDGKTIVTGIDFVYWQIYKINLTKGKHLAEFKVVNFGGPAALGFEIYDNTEDQILNAQSYGDLNVVFTTLKEIGANIEAGDPATSYSCPIGFILDYCNSFVPVCTQFVPVSLSITDPPPACLTDTVDITLPQVTAGTPSSLTFSYWNDTLATIPLLNPTKIKKSGTYYIKGSSGDCNIIKPVNVVIQSTSSTIKSTICLGSSFAGYTKSGTYIDTLKGYNGCDSIRTLNLTVKPQGDTTINIAICRGDSYRGHTKTGIYTDTLRTESGCDSLVTANLTVNPDFDLGPGKQLCLGDSSVLRPGSFKSYLWQDGSTLPYYKVVTGGVYWVKVTTEDGCVGSDTVTFTEAACSAPKIPNTFTPNGDGINDTWDINGLQGFTQCTVFIYTRWGQLVFKSNGYPRPWDGRYNGKNLPAGTYYYVIDLNNNTQPVSGFVTIIR
jgi:gliding motility-associated-like protein